MADALHGLATIEQALKRKRSAVRALAARIHVQPGQKSFAPCSDSARLVQLRHEIESLERSKEAELLKLATPAARIERRAQLDEAAKPSEDVLERAEPVPPAAAEPEVAPFDPDAAWRAHQQEIKLRQQALRASLASQWREGRDKVRAIKQNVMHRVDTRFVYTAHGDGPEHLLVPANTLIVARPVPNRAAKQTYQRRREAAILNRELMSQRQAEWERRAAYLESMRKGTPKRVDDHLGPEIARAKPISSLSVANDVPAAWRDLRRAASGRLSMALGTQCGDQSMDGPIDIGDAEGMGACWYDYDEDGVRSPLLYTTAAQIPKERYPAAPDDPVRYAYTSEHSPARARVRPSSRQTSSSKPTAAANASGVRRPKSAQPGRAQPGTDAGLCRDTAASSEQSATERKPAPAAPTAAAARTATYEQMRKLLNIEMRRSAVRTIRRTGNWAGAVSR